jgi:hypothetical protein
MRTSVSTLDDALDRVSGLDFEVPNPFVNHAPMACEALAALGFDADIDDWVRRFEATMRRAVQPVVPRWPADFDWRDLVGDYRLLPEWMGYFERAVAQDGWPDVVRVWVPRLMPGLAAALFHGVIRTSHAVRAIEAADTAARRAELARALGNWATWFGPGRPIDEVRHVGEDAGSAVVEAAALGARCYVTAPTIFNLHGVTGAMAVHLLSAHIAPADAAFAFTQLEAEHVSLYHGTPIADVAESHWDEGVSLAASKSYDPHQVKLVEACRRGFDITGDAGFVVAAQAVTSERR